MPKHLPSLVFLPAPPSPATTASLSAAYRPSIVSVVSALKVLETSTELLVVLPFPAVHGRLQLPRSQIYQEVQGLLAGLYSLICIVCAKLGADVESDTPGSIDARILLLDYDSSQNYSTQHGSVLDDSISGPIVDLPTFALTRRRWHLIFSVDGEEAQKLLADYTNLANRTSPPAVGHLHRVDGGLSLIHNPSKPVPTPSSSAVHHVVIVGGTFDHIHAGHKLLLTALALVLQPTSKRSTTPRRLMVGITGDELLKNKKYAEYLKSWDERQRDVVNFFRSILYFTRSNAGEKLETCTFNEPGPNGRAIHTKLGPITLECVEIQDPFGPTITDESITALVVSGETRSGGRAVNEKRTEKGWHALEVFEVDVLDAQEYEGGSTKTEEFACKISSTAIRKRKAESAPISSL